MKRATPLPVLGIALLSACASPARPGDSDPPYAASGSYRGRLVVERQAFEGVLVLRPASRGRLSGTLRIMAPLQIDGSVRGERIDELLRLTVTYRGDDGCEGNIEGILTVSRDGSSVEGPVTVHDCNQAVPGTLTFTR